MNRQPVRLLLRGTTFAVDREAEVHPAELELALHREAGSAGPAERRIHAVGQLRRQGRPALPVEGTVAIRLLPRPRARWELRCGDGTRLLGRAAPKWLVPIDSVTRLWLRLERDGDVVALALFRFDLRRDLMPLLDALVSRGVRAGGSA